MPTKTPAACWLMKSEPEVFAFDDLVRAPRMTAPWDGVRNYQARNFLRDGFKVGDTVLFYHSSTDVPGIVGLAVVSAPARPDPSAMDQKSPYFDAKALARGANPWVLVDVTATHRLRRPVTRPDMSSDPVLRDMQVLQRGNRLSVMPVAARELAAILRLGGPEPLGPAR